MPDNLRSFAIAIQWIIIRLVGNIPGPILFGTVIDSTCLFQRSSCDDPDEDGACYLYDNKNMSYYFLAISIASKCVTIGFFLLALWLYKPPPQQVETIEIEATTSDKNAQVETSTENLGFERDQ